MSARSPSQKWVGHPNLQRRPRAPMAGRGRLQRMVARAFLAGGDVLTATQVYDWCFARDRRRARSQGARWSVRRVLMTVAEPIDRVPPYGAWRWRLKP